MVILLACVIGLLAGYGAVLFTLLIDSVTDYVVRPVLHVSQESPQFRWLLGPIPALGLLLVAWFTRRFAPEAQGHGVPEVITAVARHDGIIRPRVSIIKILASGVCIGTGGSVGREGPIVQIGSALGSSAAQMFQLSARNIKVLVAAGAAAGISATFNAPLAGVVFASEIILGSFAVESMTPVVVASVLANVVQQHLGEHGLSPAFGELNYRYLGNVEELPFYFVLGLVCGLAAVSFTKLLYGIEDMSAKRIPKWWARALLAGAIVGLCGIFYPTTAPANKPGAEPPLPPLFGVGYAVVDHTVHLQDETRKVPLPAQMGDGQHEHDRRVFLDRDSMLTTLLWLLPLVFLKPLLTSITLAGGGSGGIFAPSLFIGATVGACFGILMNLLFPTVSGHPGVYAIVGMGAVVAGTTHGALSAILIVYEMTDDYNIILPIMIAAGLASVVAKSIDPESIYHKKLSRRGESLTRGHQLAELENIHVRDLMIRDFPIVDRSATVTQIIEVARKNPDLESFPVMTEDGKLRGIIRPEDLHRLLDSDVVPDLVVAEDIALQQPVSVSPDENLLEALRDFGSRDVDTLLVEEKVDGKRQLVGLLRRADVMHRYRQELLARGEY